MLPCPSPTPGVYSNSCPLSRWCHPTISSSSVPFSSCLQSFPASGSFQMSQLFVSDGQSIGVSTRVTGLSSWNWIPSTSLPYFSVLFQSFMPLQMLQVCFFFLIRVLSKILSSSLLTTCLNCYQFIFAPSSVETLLASHCTPDIWASPLERDDNIWFISVP